MRLTFFFLVCSVWGCCWRLLNCFIHALLAEAEIKTIEIKRETDQFVILASDGLWDVMTSEEAVDYVHAVMAAAMGSDGEREKWSGSGGSGGDSGIEDGSSSMGSGGEGGGEERNAPGKFLIFVSHLFSTLG